MYIVNATDGATPMLTRLYDRVAPGRRRPLMTVIGRKVEKRLRQHFANRDAQGNRRGWSRSHFWNRIRRATAFAGATDTAARIAIADPAFAFKVRGGVIRPVDAKAIALPLRDEAKVAGRPRARLIPGLFILKTKRGGAYLARREERALRFYYKLVKSVSQRPDLLALPFRHDISADMTEAAKSFVDREVQRGFSAPPPAS